MNQFLVFLFILTFFPIFSQSINKKDYESHAKPKISIYLHDTVYEAEIAPMLPKISTKQNKYYAWYKQRAIWYTQGVYDGNLLHGIYKKFDPSNRLKVKGEYKYGLKHGVWHYLKNDGKTDTIQIWKKGRLTKKFRLRKYFHKKNKDVNFLETSENKKTNLKQKKPNSKTQMKKSKNELQVMPKIEQDSVYINNYVPIFPSSP